MTFPPLFFSYNLLSAALLKSIRNGSASIISTGASFFFFFFFSLKEDSQNSCVLDFLQLPVKYTHVHSK